MSYGVGCRRGADPVLLWLWHWLHSLGTSICRGFSPKKTKDKKKTTKVTVTYAKQVSFGLKAEALLSAHT